MPRPTMPSQGPSEGDLEVAHPEDERGLHRLDGIGREPALARARPDGLVGVRLGALTEQPSERADDHDPGALLLRELGQLA